MASTELRFSVITDDTGTASRVNEAFARVAIGLALDGIEVTINLGPPESEGEG